MALAGSAIGLGNIWRFPYIMGEHGGAAFIVVYILCTLCISLPTMLCEIIIGRSARRGTYEAMVRLAPGTKWKYVGVLTVICAFVIVSYYSVVGGWSVDFLVRSCISGPVSSSGAEGLSMFGKMSSSIWEPIFAHTVFLGVTALIVRLGVKNGIEKFSKITIPILFLLMVVIAGYVLTIPGSGEGVKYLIKPDFSRLDLSCVAYAMGQSFYSMSLGVGCVLIYSSYLRSEENIAASSALTGVFDTFFAILAGFAVMPAVFAAGLAPGSGPALVYETLPYIFAEMSENAPVISYIITILFFVAILTAALTSAISMFEVCVAHLVERKGVLRPAACTLIFAAAWVVGVLCSLSFGVLSDVHIFNRTIFGFCDVLTSNYLMVFGALAFAIFVGWKMKKDDVYKEFTNHGTVNVRLFKFLYFLVRWIIPVMIAVIFATNLII